MTTSQPPETAEQIAARLLAEFNAKHEAEQALHHESVTADAFNQCRSQIRAIDDLLVEIERRPPDPNVAHRAMQVLQVLVDLRVELQSIRGGA